MSVNITACIGEVVKEGEATQKYVTLSHTCLVGDGVMIRINQEYIIVTLDDLLSATAALKNREP